VEGGGVSFVESRCVTTPSENVEDLVRALASCRVHEFAIAL
jgi:hypothetical protein